MNPLKALAYKAKRAKQKNFTYRHFFIMFRRRSLYLRIIGNFQELEGSRLAGIKKFNSIMFSDMS